ncbi:hypothetical protein NC652_008476 [Populus alba x Populus x berolinensis]|nr:hypothetical protein NC652_008476 [Populus alba x Populus x berolinensis]
MLFGFIIAMAVLTESDVIMKRRRPTKEQRRVVVTGMGAVTSIDHGVDVFYTNLPGSYLFHLFVYYSRFPYSLAKQQQG